jgi:hypothetical protein
MIREGLIAWMRAWQDPLCCLAAALNIATLAWMRCLISMMKSLVFALALFGTLIAAPQKSNAAEVVHGPRGTAVRTGNGTAVHTNYNWDNAYWRTHKYGYWGNQHGYWHVVNGKHVLVVVR